MLPKDKFDDNNIEKLKNLSDGELEPLIPELLTWLQDYNWPVAEGVLRVLTTRENLVFPHIEEILESDDLMWKIWIMDLLIPQFSHEHKLELKERIEELMTLSGTDEDTQAVIGFAKACYEKCFV